MFEFEWVVRYVGIAYLMVSGMVLQAAIVGCLNVLVREKRMAQALADSIKVANLFLFFLLASYVMGAVFLLAREHGVHNNAYTSIFSLSGFVFLIVALLLIKKISVTMKKTKESESLK